jgi:hypothetical protein
MPILVAVSTTTSATTASAPLTLTWFRLGRRDVARCRLSRRRVGVAEDLGPGLVVPPLLLLQLLLLADSDLLRRWLVLVGVGVLVVIIIQSQSI